MIVEEIFSSVQGEGVHIGTPTTFIRFVGCTRNCKWCDTGYGDVKREIPQKKLLNDVIIHNAMVLNNRHIVLTGGEPLVQKSDELMDLVTRLLAQDFYITIETNGDIVPSEEFIEKVDLFSISPKLSSAGDGRFMGDNLFNYHIRGANMSVKFVVDIDSAGDVSELLQYWDFFMEHKIRDFPIIVQPKDGKMEDVAELYELLGCEVRKRRLAVQFLPQLHKVCAMK